MELIRPHHWLVKRVARAQGHCNPTSRVTDNRTTKPSKRKAEVHLSDYILFTKASIKVLQRTRALQPYCAILWALKDLCCGGKVAVETATKWEALLPFCWLTHSIIRRVHCLLRITTRNVNIISFRTVLWHICYTSV